MSGTQSQLAAVVACLFMKKANYVPATLISIGVGNCRELMVWQWLLPQTIRVGVDPRGRRHGWDGPYVTAAIGDGSVRTLEYCGECRSTICGKLAEHGRISRVSTVTIDEVARDYPGPYFLWMDCEGSELAALRGAAETLKNTRWMSLEVRNFDTAPQYEQQLLEYARTLGFKTKFSTLNWPDRLFYRR